MTSEIARYSLKWLLWTEALKKRVGIGCSSKYTPSVIVQGFVVRNEREKERVCTQQLDLNAGSVNMDLNRESSWILLVSLVCWGGAWNRGSVNTF